MYTFPNNEILTLHLSSLIENDQTEVNIILRSDYLESSTFPVEIVTCQTSDGKILNLFCKYLAGMGPNNFGHRGGLEYEAKIYEHILERIPLSKIKYFGQCRLDHNDDLLLVIEYLGEKQRMLYSDDPDALIKAATWIGKFHTIYENKFSDHIKIYDRDYYFFWSERFRNSTKIHHNNFPWLNGLANYYNENIKFLIEGDQTIIHGEYYPRNILLREGMIYPVDWESTAFAAGEIDLASLIEGWDIENTKAAIDAYKKSRWPKGIFNESEFENRLLLARIYFHFWWWEENSDTFDLKENKSLQQLQQLSIEAGIF